MIDSPIAKGPRVLALKVALAVSGPALLLALYWPALGGPFLLDDQSNLARAHLDRFSLDGLWQVATGNVSGWLGRPVAAVSFALNYLIGDGTSHSFKIVNLALHACNAALAHRLCLELLPALAARGRPLHEERALPLSAIALIVSLAWAVHPLQVSTVMYVVQRMTILATGFSLLSLILYARMRRSQIETGAWRLHLVPLTVGTTLLACFSKETGVLVLPCLMLVEWTVFRFATHDRENRRALEIGFHAFVTAPVLLGALYFVTHLDSLLGSYEARDFDLRERLLTQASVIPAYLKMVVAPNLADMAFYHDGFPVTRTLDLATVRDVSIVTLLVLAVPLSRRRAPMIAFAIGLFLVSHLLESTVLPLELMFEHRNYTGALGPILLIVWYGAVAFGRMGTPRPARLAAAAALVLLSLQTFARANDWGSDLSLAAFGVEHRPQSSRARSALAIALATRGRYTQAVEHLEVAAELDPDNAYDPLAIVQLNALANKFDERAFDRAKVSLARHPLTPDSTDVLFKIHGGIENGASATLGAERALVLFDTAAASTEQRIDLGTAAVLHARHADLLSRAGRTSAAIASLEKAARMQPANTEIRLRLIEQLARADRSRAAAEALRTLHLEPEERRRVSARLDRLTRRLSRSGIDPAKESSD